MNDLLKICLSIIITIMLSLSVFSHSGRTDANGGHRSAGGYHYHHGYPAHSHTDGKCPYDFDDQTDHSSKETTSSGSTSTNKTSSATGSKKTSNGNSAIKSSTKIQTEPDKAPSLPSQSKSKNDFSVIAFFIIAGILCFGLIFYIYKKKKKPKKPYVFPVIRFYRDLIPADCTVALQTYYLANRFKRTEWYPIPLNIPLKESKYAVFFTAKGSCYHKKNCSTIQCSSVSCANIYNIFHTNMSPCQKCSPSLPKDPWLNKFEETIRQDDILFEKVKQGAIEESKFKSKWKKRKHPISQNELLADSIEKEQRLPFKITATFQEIGCQKWSRAIHLTQDQIERYKRAVTENIKLKQDTPVSGYYEVVGSHGDTYKVTESACTCNDFKYNTHGKAPCKHMYYLANELLHQHYTRLLLSYEQILHDNNKTTDTTPEPEEKPINKKFIIGFAVFLLIYVCVVLIIVFTQIN